MMGGPSASGTGRRRRWTQRSCRAGGAGGVVRRTVAAPEERVATAPTRRSTAGFAHVDKQRRVYGLSSQDSRSSSRSTIIQDILHSDLCEHKHKRSSSNATKCLLSEPLRNEIEIHHSLSSVMSESRNHSTATEKPSFSWSTEKRVPSNKKFLPATSTASDYGLHYCHKLHHGRGSNNAKETPTPKESSDTCSFSYQLARGAGRSDSMNMGPASGRCSLAETMSMLRQRQFGRSHQNQNCISALNRRHRITQSEGAINIVKKEETYNQSDLSTGRHWQTLLDNALVRKRAQPPNEESSEQLWSCANSESDKAICCFSSGGSIDGLQVSFSSDTSDTSDNSNLSSLGATPNDQWRMSFKKVHCPLAARINYIPQASCKEIDQTSPVSVLEYPAEDFSDAGNIKKDTKGPHAPLPRPELVNFPSADTDPEVAVDAAVDNYLCSEMEATETDETIQLVEGTPCEFEDEEEREFCYLLDILIASGIHGIVEDLLYKVCQSLDCPAGYDVFDKLEKKYQNVAQWSRADRKLTFDMVNSILSEVLAPCLDMHPWATTATNMAPAWGSEGLLEKLLQVLTRRREELVPNVHKKEKRVFDQKWPDVADYIDRAGRDVERMIKDDLLEELVLELMSN
ncbi:uncharacterized protein LOC123453019 [Hordeum vulgare subsp. vulgare]|uniref:Predicted protein n=1 Tax=Hordeum vulgare subsp. vulgare TaxID=112509 RepID=F2DRP5_HORVV|nr:uncharacterized protein LOC123453019 [Hordeum vulgare subsp. vulgare]BAJ97766.1 predicted protein [Hordeum vulgare subsp. vulgare]